LFVVIAKCTPWTVPQIYGVYQAVVGRGIPILRDIKMFAHPAFLPTPVIDAQVTMPIRAEYRE
jgi:hypothetical protein